MSSKIQIPSALLTAPMATVNTMNIETNVLDPIIVNQNFCRFVLERKGILDTGSAFTFSVHPVHAGDGEAFLPLKTGIHSLIKRAVLRIGAKVVAITDDYAHYQTIRRQFKTPEEKSQKDMVKNGTTDVLCPSIQQDGKLQLRDVNYVSNTEANIIKQYKLTSNTTHTPIFSIRISELFPMMRNVQLPLFLINEPCSIELTFNTQATGAGDLGKIACFNKTYANGGDTSISVATNNVKFLADYLTYDDNTMNETAKMVMSDSGMVIPYEDVVLTNTQYGSANPAPGATAVVRQDMVRDLGLSGMMVRAILVSQSLQTNNGLLGRYCSPAYNVPDEYQIRINDNQRYPRPVNSESQKAYQLSQVFNTDIAIANCEYSNDQACNKNGTADQPITNQMLSANTLEGENMTDLAGQQHYIGVDLSLSSLNQVGNGVTVGQKPIQFLHTINRTLATNDARDVRFFSLIERQMILKGGQVMVSA